MRIIHLSLVLFFGLLVKVHAEDLNIRLELADICSQRSPAENQMQCVGEASAACMSENEGGETTVDMSGCTSLELDHWDLKLNQAYSALLNFEKTDDEEIRSYQSSAPSKAPALKEMQRKWITFRDALCQYEVSQWGGGTGGGPAFMSCMMSETARQYFVLQNRIGERK
jgi:uncharacterized protein YecT (DUF1311 family)